MTLHDDTTHDDTTHDDTTHDDTANDEDTVEATRTLAADPAAAPSVQPSSGSLDGGRFAPGTVLAGRYRLVAMLGRGGMGEVYRAEDLKLGEPVALKFLPEHLSLDAVALARFHREVRVARQIAHRNVCRVHDIGEAEGYHFLTMEYIDGEDLSTLLRRIGRLPQDKAAELAGQICRGLAAAHDAGVLHRDLKPANVMIDGRGRAKITDFGLASLQDELRDSDQDHFAGTPAYMAPEQLRGGELTPRTDLYALGLVLYELFTGRKAFPEEDWRRLVARGGRDAPPPDPASHVDGLDASVSRALLRCLEEDPSDRPRSALEVAAALPGGDPLRAALEAGETPSPEMVAGVSQQRAVLSVRAGAVYLAVFVIAILAHHLGADRLTLLGMVDPEKHPKVLEDKASTLLDELGWPAAGGAEIAERFGSYRLDEGHLGQFEGESMEDWRVRSRQRPSFITYYFRTSSGSLFQSNRGQPTADEPRARPGDALVVLDHAGRLDSLRLDPMSTAPEGEPDWSRLFGWAELDPEAFELTETPPVDGSDDLPLHDARSVWAGQLDRRAVRVEAASFGALPVWFRLFEPGEGDSSSPTASFSIWLVVAFFAVLLVAVVVAARNVRRGRGDVSGAVSIGIFLAVASLVSKTVYRYHSAGINELALLVDVMATAAFRGVAVFLIYLAMEPAVRSRAPELLVSWTRLVQGRWNDALVSRDVLIGFAISQVVLVGQIYLQPLWRPAPWTIFAMESRLGGVRNLVGFLNPFHYVAGILILALVLVVLTRFTRRRWLAAALLILVASVLSGAPSGALLFVGLLAWLGPLASMAGWFAADLLSFGAATADPANWWAWPNAWLLPTCCLVVAFLAFRNATGLGTSHGIGERAA